MKRKPKFEYRGEQFLSILQTRLFFSTEKTDYDPIEVVVDYYIQVDTLKIKSIVVDEYTIPEFYTKDDVSNLVEFVRNQIKSKKIELPMFIHLEQKEKKFVCDGVDCISEYVFV